MPRKKHEINPECGKRLKLWLDHVGLSAKTMCEAINYTPQYMSDIITGKKRLTPELAETIAKIPSGYIDHNTGEFVDLNIPIAEKVRSAYLLLKDDYMTHSDWIQSHIGNRHERDELILRILELHGYCVKDATKDMPVLVDKDDREYQDVMFAFISPDGKARYFPHKDLLELIGKIDDYIEMLCMFQFRKL